ncbi:MAG: aminotransferase class I/II-fold pyridoxal phosphate-dependent enzyme, partial [Oricola sp.]|nr:aminotransferase class I/II-fold pyridoxal phosphate-dependent enzyme [Oricola sp.]
MSLPAPRPGILNIKPYKPGSSAAPGAAEIHKLSSNESALGASPKAVDAYKSSCEALYLYPEGTSAALREKIGEIHGIDPARVICGAGSDEILQLLARAYLGPGDNIIQSAHGFLVYAIAAMACGAETRFAPEQNLTGDVDAILDLVDEKTRIVFLANPNNPTGTMIGGNEVVRLADGLPEGCLLVLDGAYAEFVEGFDG